MVADKKVIIVIDSLKSYKFEDGKKINLIKSICKYFDYTCHVYVDDDKISLNKSKNIPDVMIEIECEKSKTELLIKIFKDFDIYIDSVDYWVYHYKD